MGASDGETRQRVLGLFDQCLDLAVAAGIRTIVIHSGANINMATWDRIKNDYPGKLRELRVIADHLRDMLDKCAIKGFKGKLAWENVPWPFDIPDTLTYSNIVARDFTMVLSALDEMAIPNLGQLGVCIDLCHSWILERVASTFSRRPVSGGKTRVPPGVFPAEEPDFLALADMKTFIKPFTGKFTHVHLADSAGDLVLEDDGITCKNQPTEGDELGTGDLTRSPVLDDVLHMIASGLQPGKDGKIMCTLEVKDKDFTSPVKAARSLAYLASRYGAIKK
jgi:hypothetical protein